MGSNITIAETRVVLVDDDADARLYLQDVLEDAGGYHCTGSFSNATEALNSIPQLNPDLVLMDIHMPDLNGIECTRRLKAVLPHLKIVMLTGLHDDSLVDRSLSAGAVAYLLKPVTADQCLATLKCAVSQKTGSLSLPESSTPPASGFCPLLTIRENEIMTHLAEGLLYKEIADKLQISYSAVHKLQHKIFVKFQVGNRTEAISKWRSFFR